MKSRIINQTMIVTVNNHTYSMGIVAYQATLQIAKDKFLADKVNAIYAIVKDNIVQMDKQVFESTGELYKAKSKYEADGFTVEYVEK